MSACWGMALVTPPMLINHVAVAATVRLVGLLIRRHRRGRVVGAGALVFERADLKLSFARDVINPRACPTVR